MMMMMTMMMTDGPDHVHLWADPFPKIAPYQGIWTHIKFMNWASPSQQSKWHHDRFSYFRTGNGKVS